MCDLRMSNGDRSAFSTLAAIRNSPIVTRLMELAPAVQYLAFAVMTFIAVAGALGMTTTMSMYRSAIFLMASFIGVGGLFILLLADLLGLLQVMMYIGGMLVMALFMVLFSGDPGGAMMTSMMMLSAPEKFFSLGLTREDMVMDDDGEDEEDGKDESEDENENDSDEGEDDGGDDDDEDGMDMEPMFILNQKTPAAVLATVVGLLLSALVLFRPAWDIKQALPNQNSAEQIGDLLMGKYMIAFEGAGLMILLGIFGAVFLARPWTHPDPTDRDEIQAAVAEVPAPAETDALDPLFETDLSEGREAKAQNSE
jgi:NADH-quinone oxidoreductase subunit J